MKPKSIDRQGNEEGEIASRREILFWGVEGEGDVLECFKALVIKDFLGGENFSMGVALWLLLG